MGLQIRTYVNGNQEFIELYGDENIDMEISFAEIQDITKKNSAFTQEFKVPGSKNNNYIFNYFYDINTVALDWNPKKKFEADLIYDGYEIYNGYVRLNSVSINKIEKIYSITFYSAVGDLAANIGDKALCNLDTSSLNHSFYDSPIVENLFFDPSLHPTSLLPQTPYWNGFVNPVSKGDVNYILGQRGYDYTGTTYGTIRDIDTAQTPILDFSGVTGFFDFSGSPLISSYLIPSIRTRTMYELIVNQAGYEIESNFFDTDYFGRYYIPLSFNSDQPFMAQSEEYNLQIDNNSGYTTQWNQKLFYCSANTAGDCTGTTLSAFTNILEAEEIIKDNLGMMPLSTKFSRLMDDLNLSGYSTYFFAVPPSPSPYTWEASIDNVYVGPGPGTPPAYGDFVGYFSLFRLSSGYNPTSTIPLLANTLKEVRFFAYNDYSGHTNNYYMSGNSYSVGTFGVDLWFLAYRLDPGVSDVLITGMTFNFINSGEVLPYTIELNKEMSCDQKQIDFIQNTNKMFNLAIVEHPIKPKTLIVEPIVNYIGKGETLDWTDKVDYDTLQTLRPTTNIINGSLFLANQIDKDYINTEYNKKTNQIFGQNFIDLGIDYKNQDIKITQTLGQNTDYYLNASGDTNFALPCYFVSKESNVNGVSNFEYRPFRSLPRMIFKSVPLISGNTGQSSFFFRYRGLSNPFTPIGLVAYGTYPNVNRLTTYPDKIDGFSHYTIYDSDNVFTPDELVYPEVETQYDRYYRDYIEDLISEENKIYNCKMYLTPWEVSNLYFNEVIVIKNAKFRINKISNFSLLQPGMCDVELVKLTREYTSTPTLYYDLIKCDDTCSVIHSHTDLSYLLWAFEGQFVSLRTNFQANQGIYDVDIYKVVKTEYNPDYTYETVYFNNDFSIDNPNYYVGFDYLTYSGCSLLNPTYKLNRITGDTTPFCYDFTITNTGYSRSTFYFVNCSGDTSSWTLDPNETFNYCGYYGLFTGTGFNNCITDFTTCTGSTALPTPTPTLTPGLSPTPTPSITPTQFTPTPTQTMTMTPSPNSCVEDVEFNVYDPGYVKYTSCDGTTTYTYYTTGNKLLTLCIRKDSLLPGFPLSDVAGFNITFSGTTC
jgi:hypothetical protein